MSKTIQQINYDYKKTIKIFTILDFINNLQNKYNCKYYISKNVSVFKNNIEKIRYVISIYENINEISFDDISFNVECIIKINCKDILRKKTISLMKEDLNSEPLIIFQIFEDNEDLALLDSLEYCLDKPIFFSTEINKKEYIKFQDEIIEDIAICKKFENLIEFIPKKIINLCDEYYSIKNYENNLIRFKFLNCNKNLGFLDNDFYSDIKIRFLDSNILKFEGFLICKTSSNNILILKQENKTV